MDMQHLDTILIVMVAVYGVSVLLHISVLAGLAIGMNKAIKQAKQYADQMEAKVQPVLTSALETLQQTKALVSRLEPKLDAAATDMSAITRIAREETTRLRASADEITDRVRRQAEHAERITNDALNGVERVGNFLNSAVNTPVRQASGFIAAARAIIDTLRRPVPPRHSHPTDEEIRRERQQYV
jgi:uncharacterized protein YoxC